MQIFIPLYLSNLCFNTCTYCGFSLEHKFKRTTLSDQEILKEAAALKEKGFDHLLLLTGEAPRQVGVAYLENAINLLKPQFSSIGLEVQPMVANDYKTLIKAGADSLTIYQETYHPDAYKTYHLRGSKRDFKNRIDTPDEAGKANFYRLNIGALLGLYDWQFEALALCEHLIYLHKKHWQMKLGISFPRITKAIGGFVPKYEVKNTDLVQAIIAFRLTFPDLGITLSTREPASLRDKLFKLGITQMSAESNTAPGGYKLENEDEQFETSDKRDIAQIQGLLRQEGYDPVMKDWEPLHKFLGQLAQIFVQGS